MYIGGGIAAGLIILAAGTYFVLAPEKKVRTLNSPRGLLAQMEYAATGGATTSHVYGGQLRSERRRGNINVVAVGVPNSACVEVGASLATRGSLMINSLKPKARTRPAIVKLCKNAGDQITLRWVPDNNNIIEFAMYC